MTETSRDRNVQFLLALKSGDSEKFQWAWDKLTRCADSMAWSFSFLASSPTLRLEAVDTTMNRVVDKMNYITQADGPWDYARKIIYDALYDFARLHRVEGVEVTKETIRDTDDRAILSGVDESMRRRLETDDGVNDSEGCGWQLLRIVNEGRKKKDEDDDRYHTHRMIEALDKLAKYEWWWNTEKWGQRIESGRKRAMQSLKGADQEATLRFKECTNRLWGSFQVITTLLNSIAGPQAHRIMRLYLADFKQIEIVRYFYGDDVERKKPYVNRVVKSYLKEWGWGEPEIKKAQLILLTHHLAVLYKNSYKGDTEGFRHRIVSSPETKAYFSDLEQEHMDSLLGTCQWFYLRWYYYQERNICRRSLQERMSRAAMGTWVRG